MAFNILIVDDSDIIRRMISRTINMAGVPVGELLEADNGRTGLEVMGENWIDIVFTDINMPEMDGVTMIEKMHDDDLLKHIPIVVVSTEGSETKIEKLWTKGMKAFVKKPFTPESIRDVIRDVLGEWEEVKSDANTDAF